MIIVDTREPTDKIKSILSEMDYKYEWPEIRFEKLDHGDYLIDAKNNNLLISRKEIHDFCGNYTLLKPQLEQMRMQYDKTALLVEGEYDVIDGYIYLWRGNQKCRSCSYLTYSSFVTSQQLRGTYYYYTLNLKETILRLLYIHKYLPNDIKKAKKKS